jgi:hypothetical protein
MGRIDYDAKVFTDHNVYILGAGFCVDAGLPVLKDFLHSMRASLNWLRDQRREDEREAASAVLRFRRQAASAALRLNLNIENIEDLFSLAAASGQYPLAQSMSTAIAATLDYSRQHAKTKLLRATVHEDSYKSEDWEVQQTNVRNQLLKIPYYDVYAGLLTGKAGAPRRYMRNTVITFNYDTVLDESISKWNVPIWYGFAEGAVKYDQSNKSVEARMDEGLSLLKLHGSVNWAEPESNKGQITIYGSYEDLLNRRLRPTLIPPIWRKSFTGALSQIWDAAVTALSEATRIIIIGFSMPPTDIHIKFLLAAGLQDNISLRKLYCFDPNANVGENLFQIFRRELKEEGIAEFKQYYADALLMQRLENYRLLCTLFDRDIDNLQDLSLV